MKRSIETPPSPGIIQARTSVASLLTTAISLASFERDGESDAHGTLGGNEGGAETMPSAWDDTPWMGSQIGGKSREDRLLRVALVRPCLTRTKSRMLCSIV